MSIESSNPTESEESPASENYWSIFCLQTTFCHLIGHFRQPCSLKTRPRSKRSCGFGSDSMSYTSVEFGCGTLGYERTYWLRSTPENVDRRRTACPHTIYRHRSNKQHAQRIVFNTYRGENRGWDVEHDVHDAIQVQSYKHGRRNACDQPA